MHLFGEDYIDEKTAKKELTETVIIIGLFVVIFISISIYLVV